MKPLEGMVVLDFTQAFSGPFCTMQLADFGAKVIKIERPGIGDQSREWTPFRNGYSGYYASINRNKLGFAVDISTEEGGRAVRELAKKADVIVENFKVGTLDKFGLGYEDIKKVNPAIIYASISGFGQDTTLRKAPAYDNVIQSITGFQSLTGFPDRAGVRCGSAIGDSFTGMNCALAILMAYRRRKITGKGARIDVAMFDCIFGMLEQHILADTVKGEKHIRTGNRDSYVFAPCDVYRCVDGWYSVGIHSDDEFSRFCRMAGLEEMCNDERYASNDARRKNVSNLTEMISGYFIGKTRDELDREFEKHDITGAPVLSIPEIMEHRITKERGMVVEIQDDGIGKYTGLANPMKLSETPASYENGAPLIGHHTEQIMKEFGL